jgi:hypothetical protein
MKPAGKYTVLVNDNSHYMDDSQRYELGSFETLDEAIAACKKVVDECFGENSPRMTPGELYKQYTTFGEDPFIVSEGGPSVAFSAWEYAKERCEEICAGSDRTGPAVGKWDRLAEACTFALELHGDQFRKLTEEEDSTDRVPYISHLMAVAGLVLEHGGDEDETIAALLHDGPEDQGGNATLEEIQQRFGERVAKIVAECTDTFEQPKPEWWTRKRAYHRKLRKAPPSVLLVSAADKVHNAESTLDDLLALGEDVWARFRQGREGSLWNYANLLEIYRERVSGRAKRLVNRLEWALDGLFVDEDEKVATRFFDPSSLASGEDPVLHVVMGAVCTGKSRFIRERFDSSVVQVDAPRIFLAFCRGEVLGFPGELEEKLERVGAAVARRAVAERRSIVVEVIGRDEPLEEMARALKSCGYRVEIEALDCDVETALKRNEVRGENNISAYYAEAFHYRWLMAATRAVN